MLWKFNFNFFLFSRFFYYLTDWLTIWCLNSDNCNSITVKAIGLTSSLFNVTLSRDMPFCQLQQFRCLHHESTRAYLCSPFHSLLYTTRWWFEHHFIKDLVATVIAEVFIMLSFCLKGSVKCWKTLKMKRNCLFTFSLWLINHRGACCLDWMLCVFV